MYVLNRKSLLHTQKIHCGAGVQDFEKKTWEQDEFTQMAPFTAVYSTVQSVPVAQQMLSSSQLLPRNKASPRRRSGCA